MISLLARGLAVGMFAVSLGVLSSATVMPGPALAQNNGPRLPLDGLFGNRRPAAPVPEGGADGGPTTAQVLRIQELEAKIRQLTGTIEQLEHRNRQLEMQVRGGGGMGGDVAGGGMPPYTNRPPSPPYETTSPSSPPRGDGRRGDVFDPSQHPDAPGAPRALGSRSAEPPPPVGAPGGREAGAPLDLSTLSTRPGSSGAMPPAGGGELPPPPSRNLSATGGATPVAPPTETAKDTYDLAYGYVLRKDYALAEQTFRAFLDKYPTDRRAPDAQYWLGESLFQRQQYDAAAQSFLDLSTKHGSHAKAPDALLRLAQTLAAMKQKEMSCATLAEVGRKYPNASSSVKQGVEREQKRVQC